MAMLFNGPSGRVTVWIVALLGSATLCSAATYYVSPQGDDGAAGTSVDHPWKSCDKVLHAKFSAGDSILFQRGGEWRERLQAGSSGEAGSPITYDAYGSGAKPKFWGSDVLANADFKPAGPNSFTIDLPTEADSALADHVFILSSWKGHTLTITSDNGDPRSNGKVYTACTRGNVIFSDRKNHLVFRNLVVDETAGEITKGEVQGYGVRIEGSTDVLVENCEAYHCGRHHFAFINSNEIIGRHLKAAYVQPNTPGDNTPYVSYADTGAPAAHCITTWDDISAEHTETGHGGNSVLFVSHGDQVGLLTVKNSTINGKLSFMSAPAVVEHCTLKDNGTIENFGTGILIDGCTLLGSSTIDQYGSAGIIQNCVANLSPLGAGPTGYSTAILLRDKAKANVVRFNTLVTRNFSGLCLAGTDAGVKWYGDIFAATGAAVVKAAGSMTNEDVAEADYNCYTPGVTVGGKAFDAWKTGEFDSHSLSEDPKFVDADHGDLQLQPTSPCVGAAGVSPSDVPPTSFTGVPRLRLGVPANIGAYASR